MPSPTRRGRSAVSAVLDTVINVITLPFRVLGRLFGGRRRHQPRGRAV